MTDGGHVPGNLSDVVELDSVPDIYADGISSVEPLSGGNFRTTFFAYRRAPGSTEFSRVIVARVVRHRDSLVQGQITAMLDAWPMKQDRG